MQRFIDTNSTPRHLLVGLLAVLLTFSVGCERSPEDLEEWRNAQGGMAQLSQWAADDGEPTDVRIRAVQILVEEGASDRVPRTLEEVEDEQLRQRLANEAMPTIETMWDQQDFPELTEEMQEEGAQIPVEDYDAVRAVDAIYRMMPYFGDDAQQQARAILRDWISEDQQLRTQLADTRIPFLIEHAGDDAVELIRNWLMETHEPDSLARTLRNNLPEHQIRDVDAIIAERAEEEHPDLDESMHQAVVHADTDGIIPYLEKVIEERTSLMSDAFHTLANIGEEGHEMLMEIIENETAQVRWTAISRLLEQEGITMLGDIAEALPADEDAYQADGDRSLDQYTRAVCADARRAAESEDVEGASQIFTDLLDQDHWPATTLALQCATVFEATDIREDIAALDDDSTSLPHWNTGDNIGEFATIVGEVLDEMEDDE